MISAVDTNIFLDLLKGVEPFATSAQDRLTDASNSGPLVLCPVVYAELSAGFSRPPDLDEFLSDLTVRRDDFSMSALWQAGEAWKAYSRRRGSQVQCTRCGHRFEADCPTCGSAIVWRQHLIADFLVGAHALVQADALITRDPGYYRTYFPKLRLEVPK